jgi:trk system potassium uptake protein TrkA
MKILILGAGCVGESVAESLISKRKGFAVADTDPARLAVLLKRLDGAGAEHAREPVGLDAAGITLASVTASGPLCR